MLRKVGIVAAGFGAAAVATGAFGAHALRGHLDPAALQVWHTAVEYQFWHVLALLAVAAAGPEPAGRWWRISAACFISGMTLFCGSLYALALGAPTWTGAITPLGGAFLILGWLSLGAAFWCNAAKN